MNVLGIRFAVVNKEAQALAEFLGEKGLGLPDQDLGMGDAEGFFGAVFPAGAHSWIEMWQEGEGMEATIMLHIVTDNADAWAEQAKANGLNPHGPTDAHGERIYYLQGPGGLPIAFLSKLPS